MVTEVVEIVVRERGTRATSRGIERVGRSSRTAARAVTALVGVLATLAAGRGLAGIAAGAIEAASSFEQYGVRLRALLGSQNEANAALETFTELSAKTPFAVSQIVEGATSLASAALGNRERLEELTQTSANLAAITGLSFQEASSNLARSLQAGIGAADLFRERGVRALIESIEGIPDATKLSAEELDAAFADIFGAGGTFGGAAEALSNTLGGALSNIGDAATNLRVSLGNAFAPSVINAARGVIIPFLQQLQEEVEGNEEALAEFAAEGVRGLATGFIALVQGGLAAIQTFDQLINFARDAIGAFVQFRLELAEIDLAAAEALNSVGIVSDETLASAQARAGELRASVDELANSSRIARRDSEAFNQTLDSLNERLGGLQRTLADTDLAVAPEDLTEDVDLSGVGAAAGVETRTTSQEQALGRIEALTNRLRIADAQRLDPLDAQLERLRQQEAVLIAQANASGDITAAAEGLDIIERQRLGIEAQKTSELARQETLQAEITRLIGEATILSPQLAAEITKAADEAVRAGGGLEAVNNELESIKEGGEADLKKATEDSNQAINAVSANAQRAFSSAIRGAISGEGIDAMQLLADTGASLLEESFNSVLEGLSGQLKDLFGGGGIGGGGATGAGGFDFGGALSAGLGAGLGVLAGALRETTSNVSNNLIRSAATQSADVATRGVIAGPTNIPIFQVGAAIESAFVETNDILTEILGAVRFNSATQAGGGGAFGGPSADLETTTASLT